MATSHPQTTIDLPPELHDLHRRMAQLAVESCPQGLGPVTGVGNPHAAIFLVGEAPAEYEVREGRPFAGPAGRVLDDVLAQAGIPRASIWLSNVVKCRTMRVVNGRRENRAPLAGELKLWLPLLEEELRIVHPKVVVCLGGTAAKVLLGKSFKLTEQRGEWFDGPNGARVMATFHPAYVLHLQQHDPDRSESTYDLLLADLKAAHGLARAEP
ncbi:MAG: uracil-DNA glycosylase [Dehalococcoidia bacterium]